MVAVERELEASAHYIDQLRGQYRHMLLALRHYHEREKELIEQKHKAEIGRYASLLAKHSIEVPSNPREELVMVKQHNEELQKKLAERVEEKADDVEYKLYEQRAQHRKEMEEIKTRLEKELWEAKEEAAGLRGTYKQIKQIYKST